MRGPITLKERSCLVSHPANHQRLAKVTAKGSSYGNPSASSLQMNTPQTMIQASASTSARNYKAYSMGRKYTFYSPKTDLLQADTIHTLAPNESLSELRKDSGFHWIDVCNPSREELNDLGEMFELHPLSIDDMALQDGRERCDAFEKYVFLVVRTCDVDYFMNTAASPLKVAVSSDGSRPGSSVNAPNPVILYALVFQDCLLTIHHRPIIHIHAILRKLATEIVEPTSSWLAYALLENVVCEFGPQLRRVEAEVDGIDEQVMFLDDHRRSQTEFRVILRQMKRALGSLNHLERLLNPKTRLLASLRTCIPDTEQSSSLYMRDVEDKLNGLIEEISRTEDTLKRAHPIYLAWIQIEQAEIGNEANVQMKRLSVFATLGTPIVIVSSLWGMNVIVPFQSISGSMAELSLLGPFFALVVGSCVITILVWIAGIRYKYF